MAKTYVNNYKQRFGERQEEYLFRILQLGASATMAAALTELPRDSVVYVMEQNGFHEPNKTRAGL